MKKIIELINKFYHKHQALILIIVVFVLIISGILINNIDLNKNNKTTQQIIEEEKKSFVVNIKGEVNKERSISLNEATYLYEIINMCDGFSNYADIANINLIEIINTDRDINVKKTDIKHNNEIKLIDISNTYNTCLLYLGRINDYICIYKINKNSDFNQIKWYLDIDNINNDNINIDDFVIKEDYSIIKSNTSLININSASINELIKLDNIGTNTAKKIIEYRDNNGPFTCIEDIMKVSGIKESIFNAIKELICVG